MEHVMAKTEHANLDIRVFDKSNPNGICAYLCRSVAPTAHQNQAVGSGARVKNP